MIRWQSQQWLVFKGQIRRNWHSSVTFSGDTPTLSVTLQRGYRWLGSWLFHGPARLKSQLARTGPVQSNPFVLADWSYLGVNHVLWRMNTHNYNISICMCIYLSVCPSFLFCSFLISFLNLPYLVLNIYICIYTYIHTHIYIYICIHTYIYIHMNMCVCACLHALIHI